MTILMWVGIIGGGIIVLLVAPPIYFMIAGTEVEGVAVQIAGPEVVSSGDQFVLAVSIRNLLDRPRTLRSLDLDHSLLKGFAIESLDPTPRDTSSAIGTAAHYFDLPIPAAASITIKLHCRALQPGEFNGNFMAYVDSKHARSQDQPMRLVVR